jgi:hypothetical protein
VLNDFKNVFYICRAVKNTAEFEADLKTIEKVAKNFTPKMYFSKFYEE